MTSRGDGDGRQCFGCMYLTCDVLKSLQLEQPDGSCYGIFLTNVYECHSRKSIIGVILNGANAFKYVSFCCIIADERHWEPLSEAVYTTDTSPMMPFGCVKFQYTKTLDSQSNLLGVCVNDSYKFIGFTTITLNTASDALLERIAKMKTSKVDNKRSRYTVLGDVFVKQNGY